MICPGCRRANQAGRRYCGGCGCNFEPACDQCGFANDHDDRFCGGCGFALRAVALPLAAAAVPGFPPASAPSTRAGASTASWAADELAALFKPTSSGSDAPALPEAGISQDDVDRLFGTVP